MIYVDATCPLVSKVHIEAARHAESGLQMVMIGHAGHPETIGTMGQLPPGEVLLVEKAADVAAPASAGFFLEGLKAFTKEPRCPDPYAMDKTGCTPPDTAYPAPPKADAAPRPDVRTTTRDGAPRK